MSDDKRWARTAEEMDDLDDGAVVILGPGQISDLDLGFGPVRQDLAMQKMFGEWRIPGIPGPVPAEAVRPDMFPVLVVFTLEDVPCESA